MNYVTELYLDYLENKFIYEDIYNTFAVKYFIQEVASPEQLRSAISSQQSTLNKLVQQKADLMAKGIDNPQIMGAIDAKIKATGSTIGKMKDGLAKSPEMKGIPDQPAGGSTQADIPAAPVPKGTPTTTPGEIQAKAAAKPPEVSVAPKEAPVTTTPGATPAPTGSQVPGVVPQHPSLATQAQQTAGDLTSKAGEVGKSIVAKGAEVSKDVGGAVSTGLQKIGASPETGGAASSAIQAIGSSPLGLAALGGAAAFGGYKLYKRFMSKSATACRGYSGADKTACMRSYMDAKRNQAQTRGAEAGAVY